MKTLVVTNDFPPRQGGIQTFVRAIVDQFPADEITVFCSSHEGAREYDARSPFETVRHPSTMLLPTPEVTREVVATMRRVGADRVWFGAAAPLVCAGRRWPRCATCPPIITRAWNRSADPSRRSR